MCLTEGIVTSEVAFGGYHNTLFSRLTSSQNLLVLSPNDPIKNATTTTTANC